MVKLKMGTKQIDLKEGTELLSVPKIDSSFPLKFGCCKGMCGTCAIKIDKGSENLSPYTKQELETLKLLDLKTHRLACQCAVLGDVSIEDSGI